MKILLNSIHLIFILLLSKTFVHGNDLPNELKVAIHWRHIPELAFLNKLALKNINLEEPWSERFELTLYKVSFQLDSQFGRRIGRPIAHGNSAHYDLATLQILPKIDGQNVEGNKGKGKGKEIAGQKEIIGNEQQIPHHFELHIKMIFAGELNNQVLWKPKLF